MPLSEFLRMAGGKVESGQQKPCPTDLSSRSENDLVELVWENGQITMQGHSSRVTRTPAALNTNKDARIGKFGGVESILNDMSPIVPSGDLDLSQDDEMGPWLDAVAQGYGSVLLPEISGVTGNGMSTQNSFASGVSNLHSGGGFSKVSPSSALLSGSWPPPQHRQTSDALGSGVLDNTISNNTSNHPSVVLGNPSQGRDIVNDSTSLKMDMQNIGPPTNNNSNYLNFSYFARPANLVKAKVPISSEIPTSGVERLDVKEKGLAASGINPVANSGQPVGKETKDSHLPEKTKNLGQETLIKNEKPLTVSSTTDPIKGVPYGEKIVEPVVDSSSVGSGNSVHRVSCDQTHNSKRTFRDTEESECRSDDVETESIGVKKGTPARGCGSKRSRAAEVHNLSERRRRDRINEKMRALQELIPNCNKGDKASMLDEAIEYLKTLQLQVQIMSMGAGLCMSPMMFPPGMQHMHPDHIPHFSPLGPVGMGMGFGMGMLDINGGSPGWPVFPVLPLQAQHFLTSMSTNFQRMPGPNLPVYVHPGRGLPNTDSRVPSVPSTGQPTINSAMGLSALRNGSQNLVPSGDITNTNSQLNCNTEVGSSVNQKSDQLPATNDVLNQSATVQENKQPTDASGPTTLTSTTAATDISKEPGEQ